MTLANDLTTKDMENRKFKEEPSGDICVKTCIVNESPIDVNIASQSAATPTIYNVSLPTANTEVGQALNTDTKQLIVRVRGNGDLKVAFISTESATKFITLPAGTSLSLDGLDFDATTIYMQSTKASQIVEILELS